ncbi:GATA transcription factor 26-like [Rutidosis leptorrhynchoides]|uniref:GATA transcription factor 26-like n=1 Tax=Rutidosis leptorrhynchoides TaxID=125765 RepID=UPI003A98FBE2
MGKQGPCYHCGVTSTPLWRNGPPDKPVLCNACGSRWRTKGSLVNYTPLRVRSEPDEFEDRRVSKVKTISIKNKEENLLKRKVNYEDTSNRSSSGSVISNYESCMQLSGADASDLTGPSQSSVVWDTRKRTCFDRPKQSPVEQLTRDLHTILHEQQSYFSVSSEDDLIFESDSPMVSVEIGHGSVLIRHPNSSAREEESEASSLSIDTKNEAYSWMTSNKDRNLLSKRAEKSIMSLDQNQYNSMSRDNDEKLPILNDIINSELPANQMTNDEKQQLLKYLPPIDTVQLSDSLGSMFDNPQFKENISNFDICESATKSEGCRTLKKLALSNITKSKWVDQYNLLQDAKCKKDIVVAGVGNTISPSCSVNVQKSPNTQFHSSSGLKSATKNAKVGFKKASYEHKELIDNESYGISPKSRFVSPSDNSSLMLEFSKYADESCDQDLLLDVPSNTSFPQAELLSHSSFISP